MASAGASPAASRAEISGASDNEFAGLPSKCIVPSSNRLSPAATVMADGAVGEGFDSMGIVESSLSVDGGRGAWVEGAVKYAKSANSDKNNRSAGSNNLGFSEWGVALESLCINLTKHRLRFPLSFKTFSTTIKGTSDKRLWLRLRIPLSLFWGYTGGVPTIFAPCWPPARRVGRFCAR